MAYNWLGETGLVTLIAKIKNLADTKVNKVDGKGLSTNDYTNDEKTKLAGIEENANNYELPNASDTTLGGVKIGDGLEIDAGHCLGDCEPNDSHEFQWNIDGEAVWNDSEPQVVSGYTVTDGGVGYTVPYTVYFHIVFSAPASRCVRTEKAVNLVFDEDVITARVGISYLSQEKAVENAYSVSSDFDRAEAALVDAWRPLLAQIRIQTFFRAWVRWDAGLV